MLKALALSCLGLWLASCSSSEERAFATGGGSGGTSGGGSGGTSGGGSGGTSGGGTGGASGGASGADAGGDSSTSCAAPKTECTKGTQTVCTDTSSDDANCGQCNEVCPAGSTCKSSSCSCTDATKTFCKQGGSGVCIEPQSDPKNCGACGKVCPNNNCTSGVCDKVVFVTKASYSTNLGGVTGADALCGAAAKAAGLTGTFQAWISDGTLAPTNSFKTKSNVPYVLSDGTTKVADSFSALGSGTLQHAINKAEDKTAVTGKTVMTNVKADGSVNTVSFTCSSWSSATDKFFGGSTDSTTVTWTDAASTTLCTSSLLYHLYCFEQ